MFFFLYIVSFILVINMDDWFMVWFGLELNMLSFLVLIYDRNSLWNIESCLKYFFVQSLGSAILIGGYYLSEGNFEVVCSVILGYKIGGGPFFFWFPSVCSGISWVGCYILMTFQKFLPLFLMMHMVGWWIWMMIFVSLLMGMIGSFNQVNVKNLMAFSSIHQIGWLLMCLYVDKVIWMMYYIIYLFVLFMVVFKIMSYNVINLLGMNDFESKMWMILMMMNLGGVPPLLGFFMKWYGLYNFLFLNFFFVIIMVLFSVVMLYVYLRVCYMIMLGENMEVSWVYKSHFMKVKMSMFGMFEFLMLMGVFFGGFLFFF